MGLLDMLKGKAAPAVLTTRYSNVMGCDYTNGDGTSRQAYIKNIKPGDALFFKPAPTKEYPDSVGVFTGKGKQIGVVAYPLLNELRKDYAHNRASVTAYKVEQGNRGFFVNMLVTIYEK